MSGTSSRHKDVFDRDKQIQLQNNVKIDRQKVRKKSKVWPIQNSRLELSRCTAKKRIKQFQGNELTTVFDSVCLNVWILQTTNYAFL